MDPLGETKTKLILSKTLPLNFVFKKLFSFQVIIPCDNLVLSAAALTLIYDYLSCYTRFYLLSVINKG